MPTVEAQMLIRKSVSPVFQAFIDPSIIAAQIPVQNWHQLIPESTLADAILDRPISLKQA